MQGETDRPEQKFDEGTSQDSYFAAKEHELIEEMKTELHYAEAARREAQMMSCAKCSGKRRQAQVYGSRFRSL